MVINLSELASNRTLDALGELLNDGAIELLDADGKVLAVLKLSTPATKPAAGGELVFTAIKEEPAAPASGEPVVGRIVGADGGEIFSCDVSAEDGDATIRLNTAQIAAGEPVRLYSFRLSMP